MLKILISMLLSVTAFASTKEQASDLIWMKIKANNKIDRSRIADSGVAIEHIAEDYITAIGTDVDFKKAQETSEILVHFNMSHQMFDFPEKDRNFHNYEELAVELIALAQNNPDIAMLDSIGTTYENKNIYHLTISTDLGQSHLKPGIVFTGAHHAREHLSVEMPLMLAKNIIEEYRRGNPQYVNLVQSRQIHIIPMVNPDGAEYDISKPRYQMWRKNRRNNGDGSMGVDLNRNYGFMWGTGGSSTNTRSDTYMGPTPFSEPETQAIKAFIEYHQNITIFLSYHTFSELILYPWGHKYESISDVRAFSVHKTMAETMSQWNGYKPQQSSDLYVASGDTTDWAFGQHGIISFTFELDPKSMWQGGFYPGQDVIPVVFRKNLQPALYLIDHADNPYRVLNQTYQNYGLNSPLIN